MSNLVFYALSRFFARNLLRLYDSYIKRVIKSQAGEKYRISKNT